MFDHEAFRVCAVAYPDLTSAPMKLSLIGVVFIQLSLSPGLLGHRQDLDNKGLTWEEKYGRQYDLAFSGPLSFSHLSYIKCLEQKEPAFDIAILGIPFDTAVTYRPGFVLPWLVIIVPNLIFELTWTGHDLDLTRFAPGAAGSLSIWVILFHGALIHTIEV